jgi:hypothetical protein
MSRKVCAALLVLVAVSPAGADEEAIVKQVEALGGKVGRHGLPTGELDFQSSVRRGRGWAEAQLWITPRLGPPVVTRVDLEGTEVTDVALAGLRDLPHLSVLILSRTRVADAGMKAVGDLPELTRLFLDQTGITDAGLKDLGRLENLRILTLSGTKVTDDGVANLRKALPHCWIIR